MFEVFSSLHGLIKTNQVCIDSTVFWLNYRISTCLLVFFSVVVTSYQYVGNPIGCIVDGRESRIMNTYCWITDTFTLPGLSMKHSAYSGVGPGTNADETKYYNYYQWVSYALAAQAALFYLPRYVWKMWEGGHIQMLVSEILRSPLVIDEPAKKKQISKIVNYLVESRRTHNTYVWRYYICELLNLIISFIQMFFMIQFLDGQFSTFGWDMIWLPLSVRRKNVDSLFPKMTKCTFDKYGPSGTLQNIDGLCVLALNLVNEYIYGFLWFWVALLTIINCFQITFSSAAVFSSRFRFFVLGRSFRPANIKMINNHFRFGDWFILYMISKNVDPSIFQELAKDLDNALDCNPSAPHISSITEPDGNTAFPNVINANGIINATTNGSAVAVANGTAVAVANSAAVSPTTATAIACEPTTATAIASGPTTASAIASGPTTVTTVAIIENVNRNNVVTNV